MSLQFKVLAIIANHEREVLQSDTLQEACEKSLEKNKKTCGIIYIVERPDGTRLTIAEQKLYLEIQDNCKHLRQGGHRIAGGFRCECLSCGYVWFKPDKALNKKEMADKKSFEHSQELKGSYEL